MLSELFCCNTFDWSVSSSRCLVSFFFFIFIMFCFIKVPLINADSVDPDQMLHFAASDLS